MSNIGHSCHSCHRTHGFYGDSGLTRLCEGRSNDTTVIKPRRGPARHMTNDRITPR